MYNSINTQDAHEAAALFRLFFFFIASVGEADPLGHDARLRHGDRGLVHDPARAERFNSRLCDRLVGMGAVVAAELGVEGYRRNRGVFHRRA